MTYFPEPVFRNIASFLVDPYKRDREAHAEVWRKIRVKRFVLTTMGAYHDYGYHDVINECEYFVYIRDPRACGTDDATIPVRDGFGYDDLSGEWDNIEEQTEWTHAYVIDYEWHNWAGQDK